MEVQEFAWYIQVSVDIRLGQKQSGGKIFSRLGLQLSYGMEIPFTYDASSLILIIFILRTSLQGVFYSFFFIFFFFP